MHIRCIQIALLEGKPRAGASYLKGRRAEFARRYYENDQIRTGIVKEKAGTVSL